MTISLADEAVVAAPVVVVPPVLLPEVTPEAPPVLDSPGTVVPVVGGLAEGLAGLDIVTEGADEWK